MTLPADVLAKLDRSRDVLVGTASTAVATKPDDEVLVLRWRRPDWTREAPRPGEDVPPRDLVTGEPIPPVDVEAGWSVTSLHHIDADPDHLEVGALTGVAYQVERDVPALEDEVPTGEIVTLVHLAVLPTGDGSRGKGPYRLTLVWPGDVASARPPNRREIGEVLKAAHRELSRTATARGLAARDRRRWVGGVVIALENVMEGQGW